MSQTKEHFINSQIYKHQYDCSKIESLEPEILDFLKEIVNHLPLGRLEDRARELIKQIENNQD